MTIKELKEMGLNEVKPDGNGNRYTRVPYGWIFTSFSGNICFIPELEKPLADTVVKKDLTAERKTRTK